MIWSSEDKKQVLSKSGLELILGNQMKMCPQTYFSTNIQRCRYLLTERYTSPSKEAGLVKYLAFLAKVANLYYMILTDFKKY